MPGAGRRDDPSGGRDGHRGCPGCWLASRPPCGRVRSRSAPRTATEHVRRRSAAADRPCHAAKRDSLRGHRVLPAQGRRHGRGDCGRALRQLRGPGRRAGEVRLQARTVPHRRGAERPDRHRGALLLAVQQPARRRSAHGHRQADRRRLRLELDLRQPQRRRHDAGRCRPSGIFTPASLDADLLLFAGGSGVTPIMSITRTALAEGTGKIVVFYANRDEQSVIFAEEFTRLAAEHPERLQVMHWLESVQGIPSPGADQGVHRAVPRPRTPSCAGRRRT